MNDHHGHDHHHGPSADADRRYLSLALTVLVAYLLTEVGVAFGTGSLALLSDAAHMLTDVASIALALWAMRLAAKPAQGIWTFGLKRAEILSGLANGVTLLVLSGILLVEAVSPLFSPEHINAAPVLATALAGVVVNIVAAYLLAKANRSSLNVEGAYQHIVTDLYGFVGTTAAALIILNTGWSYADTLATFAVVGLMLRSGLALVRRAGTILLEAAPAGIDLDEVRAHLGEVDHVIEVHDLHVWSVSSDLPALSAHLILEDECFNDGHAPQLLDEVLECLHGHFDVTHSTFQFEPASHSAHEREAHA